MLITEHTAPVPNTRNSLSRSRRPGRLRGLPAGAELLVQRRFCIRVRRVGREIHMLVAIHIRLIAIVIEMRVFNHNLSETAKYKERADSLWS